MPKWSDYITGEWWIDEYGGSIEVGEDSGSSHEATAIEAILSSAAEEILEALGKDSSDEGELASWYVMGEIPDKVVLNAIGKEKFDLLKKDARLAYAKYHKMIYAINLEFVVWKLTDKHLSAIQTFLNSEAWDEVGKDDKSELSVEEAATKRRVEMPVEYFMTLDRAKQVWDYGRQRENPMKKTVYLPKYYESRANAFAREHVEEVVGLKPSASGYKAALEKAKYNYLKEAYDASLTPHANPSKKTRAKNPTSERIYSMSHLGILMTLVYKSGKAVLVGDMVRVHKHGGMVVGGTAPQREGSTGKVNVAFGGYGGSFYPSAIDAKWVKADKRGNPGKADIASAVLIDRLVPSELVERFGISKKDASLIWAESQFVEDEGEDWYRGRIKKILA